MVNICKCVLPPGDNPFAVNKYIISYSFGSKYKHEDILHATKTGIHFDMIYIC
jgi:hypothetical protein